MKHSAGHSGSGSTTDTRKKNGTNAAPSKNTGGSHQGHTLTDADRRKGGSHSHK